MCRVPRFPGPNRRYPERLPSAWRFSASAQIFSESGRMAARLRLASGTTQRLWMSIAGSSSIRRLIDVAVDDRVLDALLDSYSARRVQQKSPQRELGDCDVAHQ